MQVEQWRGWNRAQEIAFFFESKLPSCVRSQAGSATGVILVMPIDMDLEKGVGILVIVYFLVGQEADEAVLKRAKAPFDFAFCRRIGCHAVSHAQRGKGALELGMGIKAIGSRVVTEERESIRVKAGWRAMFFQDRPEVSKVRPSSITGSKGAAEDFARVVIECKNKARIRVGGPPTMR